MDVREIDGASYNGVDGAEAPGHIPYRRPRDSLQIFIVDGGAHAVAERVERVLEELE